MIDAAKIGQLQEILNVFDRGEKLIADFEAACANCLFDEGLELVSLRPIEAELDQELQVVVDLVGEAFVDFNHRENVVWRCEDFITVVDGHY